MSALDEYLRTSYPVDGDSELLNKLHPIFKKLVKQLDDLGEDASLECRLVPFAEAIEVINIYGDEIETVEREALLKCVYDIGEIVGIDRASNFAEAWPGDW